MNLVEHSISNIKYLKIQSIENGSSSHMNLIQNIRATNVSLYILNCRDKSREAIDPTTILITFESRFQDTFQPLSSSKQDVSIDPCI